MRLGEVIVRALAAVATVAVAVAIVQPPPASAQSGEASCPLPVGAQIRAVQAFRKMLPVLRHPRCSNCHGGMDVLSPAHPGAAQVDETLDPRTAPMTPDFRARFEPQCQTCHDGLAGWTVPPPVLFFVDKDDEALCKQMKGFGNDTGAKFVSHIHDDHGGIQFIATGFAGDRALGVDGLADHRLTVQKPPGTQAEMTAQARKWVEAMGGDWTGAPECGCRMPKIEAKFTQTDTGELASDLGAADDAWTVTGDLVLAPAGGDAPARPSFGDQPSSFFTVESGTITVEADYIFRGLGASTCTMRGRKSFAIESLPERLRRHLWLELAEDGRYRLSLGLQDRVWQVWTMEVDSVCTSPVGVQRDRLPVNQVAVMLGERTGQLAPDAPTEGRLAAPLRFGIRKVDGRWTLKAKPLR